MATTDLTIPTLIPLMPHAMEQRSKPGVSARVLYEFLGLNPAAYARWAKKNIVTNAYAIEHADWEITQHDVEYRINTSTRGHAAQDYALSIDFAKRLSMMARSAKGEEARQFFLDCEKAVFTKLSDPVAQFPELRAIQQLVTAVAESRIETALAREEAREAKHEAAEAHVIAQAAEAKIDTAVNNQNFWTIAEYVQYHDLRRQCPESAYIEASNHMRDYCKRYRLNFRDPNILPRRIPVGDKGWQCEWGFHTSVYDAAFLPWLLRRNSQVVMLVREEMR